MTYLHSNHTIQNIPTIIILFPVLLTITCTYMQPYKNACDVFKRPSKNIEPFAETKMDRKRKHSNRQLCLFYAYIFQKFALWNAFLKLINAVALTKHTSVKFNPHGDVSIPSSDIDTNKTSSKRSEQTMCDDEVSLLIGREDLFWYGQDRRDSKKLIF